MAAGEWTTYGELGLAATGNRAHRLVARLATNHPEFANAHRVLGSGGLVVRGDEAHARRARQRLEAEGVAFHGHRADPAHHVSIFALRGRLHEALQRPTA